jgi:guanylate kinase
VEKNPLYIIAGPTAVGKGTLISALSKKHNDIWVSISATTRKPRTNEVNKQHYYFITLKEFKNNIKQNKFLEYAIVHNNYYGTLKKPITEHQKKAQKVILEIDVSGALQVKEKLANNAVMIFVKPPSLDEMIKRLKNRNTENLEQIKIRLKTAKREMKQINKFEYIVINDDFEKALTDIEKIMYNSH